MRMMRGHEGNSENLCKRKLLSSRKSLSLSLSFFLTRSYFLLVFPPTYHPHLLSVSPSTWAWFQLNSHKNYPTHTRILVRHHQQQSSSQLKVSPNIYRAFFVFFSIFLIIIVFILITFKFQSWKVSSLLFTLFTLAFKYTNTKQK